MSATTGTNQPDAIERLIEEGGLAPRQFLIILICMLLNLSDGFDVMSWAFTADRVGNALGLGPEQLGAVASAALAGMMLGAMILAPLSDLFGRRKLIIVSVSAIAVAMFLTATVASYEMLLLLRFVAGLGVGAILASLAAIASEFAPEKYKSLAVVSITLGYPLGAMFAGMIASQILPVYDWPAMYYGGAAVNVLLAVLVWLYIPESMQYLVRKRPADALHRINHTLTLISRPQLSTLPPYNPPQHKSGTLLSNMLALLGPGYRTKTITLWLTFFFCFICLYFLLSWIPKMLIDAGFAEQQSLMGGTAFNLGAFFGVLLVGFLATRFTLSSVIGLFLATSGVLMIFYSLAPANFNLLLTTIFVIGILQQGGFTGLYAVAAKIYSTDIKATGIGWAIGLGRFGAVVGPYMAGVLIAGGATMQLNFTIFAVPMIVGGILAWSLKVK